MYQLGKSQTQIIPEDGISDKTPKLTVYLQSIMLGISLCAKTVVIIYHFSDDDEITAAARHIESACDNMVFEIHRRWNHIFCGSKNRNS